MLGNNVILGIGVLIDMQDDNDGLIRQVDVKDAQGYMDYYT